MKHILLILLFKNGADWTHHVNLILSHDDLHLPLWRLKQWHVDEKSHIMEEKDSVRVIFLNNDFVIFLCICVFLKIFSNIERKIACVS